MNEVLNQEALEDMFHLPLSQQAFAEFQQLTEICHSARQRISDGEKDRWTYIWGNSHFSPRNAYKMLVGYQTVLPHFRWDRKSTRLNSSHITRSRMPSSA